MSESVETLFMKDSRMSSELIPGLGHNNPPEITEMMAQEQTELYPEKLQEIERIIQKENEVPAEIIDDETAGRASDFIKVTKSIVKESDGIRLSERKKYTIKSDAIQSFWKKRLAPVEDAMGRVQDRLAPYLKAKEDAKRRAAEEKARKAQEEADRKLKEAQEKERIAREAQAAAEKEAKRIADEAAEKLRKQEEDAKAKREAAEKEAARLKAEADAKLKAVQEENDRLKREAEEAEEKRKAKVLQDEADKEAEEKRKEREKIAADALKAATKDVKTADKSAASIIKETEKEIRQDAKDVRAEIAELDEGFSDLRQEAKEAERDKNKAMDAAVRADKDHARAEKQTLAGSAELSRTRGDGSVASATEEWTADVQDRDELLYSAKEIWDHIPFAALDQALKSWVKANEANRVLRGALVYQITKTMVR